MPGPVFLSADGLDLRTVEREDLPFLHEAHNDPDTRVPLGLDGPYSRGDIEEYYEETIRDDDGVSLLVCPRPDADIPEGATGAAGSAGGEQDAGPGPVGLVSLFRISERDRRGWLAYWITPEHRREGYARAAIDRLLAYAFETRHLRRVCANVYEPNEGSARLLEDLGFRREGVRREHSSHRGEYVDDLAYGLLADEYEENA